MCFRRIPPGDNECTDDADEDPPDSSIVSSHDVDSLLCTRWWPPCVGGCGCNRLGCSTDSFAVKSGFGDNGGGMYVRSMGDSGGGLRSAGIGFGRRPGGGCRWNCEVCIPRCTSRMAVEMTDSRGPYSLVRKGSWCAGGGSGSALSGRLSIERSLTIRAMDAV